MNSIIQIKNLSKNYNSKTRVLKNLSFNFKAGKTYSLTGPSGSGKSTLLNLISLIDKPSSGSIKIDNTNINFSSNNTNDKIRSKIAKNGKSKYFKLFNETKISKYIIDISLGNKSSLF